MLTCYLLTKVFLQVYDSNKKDLCMCRLVCQQWNTLCIKILNLNGIKISLASKRQSKQLLYLLKKSTSFSLSIQHLVVRSKVYLMNFIPIICSCPSLKSLDLGGSKDFYRKLYNLLLPLEGTSRMRDLPKIEEFKFDDETQTYTADNILACNLINVDITLFRHSIKRLQVVSDFVDVPGFYRGQYMLKDGFIEMSNLEHINVKYLDIFPSDVSIGHVMNSNFKRLKSLKLIGLCMRLTSVPMGYINPAFTLRKLDIQLPCMDVNVLRYIEKALPKSRESFTVIQQIKLL